MGTALIDGKPSSVMQFTETQAEASKMFTAESTVSAGSQALFVESRPIFRSGTFRDSMGDESTWDGSHIDQMAFHFGMLRDRGILKDIPVRAYHPDTGGIFGGSSRNPMDELIGYITSVRAEEKVNPVDGATYSYLVADYEILDETAKEKISSGLWRNLSAEVGGYVTNANAEYYPVLRGVAYVDFSAVEGLNTFSESTREFSLITEEPMAKANIDGAPKSGQPAPPGRDSNYPEGTVGAGESASGQHEFTIGDQKVSDFSAVQSALNELVTLREFKSATEDNARESFIDSMIESKQLASTQRDSALAYARSLDAKQFNAWADLQRNAPVIPLLDNHAPSGNNEYTYSEGGEGNELSEKEQRIELLSGMVHTHSLSGMPTDKIKQLSSYKELVELDSSFTL